MKRVFKFKKGETWDGDEEIVHCLEDYLLEHNNLGGVPKHKKDRKVTLVIESLKK